MSRSRTAARTGDWSRVPTRNRVYGTDDRGRPVIIGHICRRRGRAGQYLAGVPECYVAHPHHEEDQTAVTETWEAAKAYLLACWDARELVR